MKYLLYTFTGITRCDGETIALPLQTVIKDYSKLFTSVAATTNELFESKAFCLSADNYEMKDINALVEKGIVIVPFSRTFFVADLLNYYNLGMDVMFMKIKDYKQFKEDYTDSLVSVEDNRTKNLF